MKTAQTKLSNFINFISRNTQDADVSSEDWKGLVWNNCKSIEAIENGEKHTLISWLHSAVKYGGGIVKAWAYTPAYGTVNIQ